MTGRYAEAVWDEVVVRAGPVGGAARQAYTTDLESWERDGFTVAQATGVLLRRMADAQRQMSAGLAAFGALVKSVDLAGRTMEATPPPDELMTHLLDAKLELARLYHHLAQLAPFADAKGVASPAETARMVAESQADVERWADRPRPVRPG